jgi:hypothetical protein
LFTFPPGNTLPTPNLSNLALTPISHPRIPPLVNIITDKLLTKTKPTVLADIARSFHRSRVLPVTPDMSQDTGLWSVRRPREVRPLPAFYNTRAPWLATFF